MSSSTSSNKLGELVSSISSAAADMSAFCDKLGLGSISSTAPLDIKLTAQNQPYFTAKAALVGFAEELIRLVRGPRDHLLALSFEHCASASLQIIIKYKLASHVPLQGATTCQAIADAVGKPEMQPALVGRIMQHASSYGLFEARPGGAVAHNAASAMLATDPDLAAWMNLSATVAYPAGASLPGALAAYGYSMEADEAAYGVSIGRRVSQFQRFREPDGSDLHDMFAGAMRGIAAGGAYDLRHAVDGGYPWHALEAADGGHLVVDVGGGSGHVCFALAAKHPRLRFEVQDLPETVAVAERSCPAELRRRIHFRAHDFMTPQPARDDGLGGAEAVAYFCRFILHDWSDKYAQRILQGLASALRPQDRIIVNEAIAPEPNSVDAEKERRMHDRDMLMLMNLNGRERTMEAFRGLCDSVEPRLKVHEIHHPAQGELSLIELKRCDATF
ncbi:O-methyltransferase ctb2 [Pyricularia oryzae]|nr:O-methyltransferase ctb2 [Pyricularia oryzae]KAI6342079.1 O-methyltransferase ctb2 [Pyricularia oryzae]KAI6591868.1 O-methyltransferase ctb2 [Pyricularia oryzae]KAI6605653.1 O-methyltransferase ctb2 [Pyricularia oryzae]KAI6613162.1 O-methyltransferase ctb2 [Pyricularia oryzae]